MLWDVTKADGHPASAVGRDEGRRASGQCRGT